jgi:hypothetical protein
MQTAMPASAEKQLNQHAVDYVLRIADSCLIHGQNGAAMRRCSKKT